MDGERLPEDRHPVAFLALPLTIYEDLKIIDGDVLFDMLTSGDVFRGCNFDGADFSGH